MVSKGVVIKVFCYLKYLKVIISAGFLAFFSTSVNAAESENQLRTVSAPTLTVLKSKTTSLDNEAPSKGEKPKLNIGLPSLNLGNFKILPAFATSSPGLGVKLKLAF